MKDPAAKVFYGSMRIVGENGELKWVAEARDWNVVKYLIAHPTCFVKRSVYDQRAGAFCFRPSEGRR